jgi:zinc protease
LVEPVQLSGRHIYVVDRPGAPQTELRLAMLAPKRATEDYYTLQVLNTVLGGGFSSRLNLNLREQKGFSYSAFSALRFGRFQSLILGIAPVETGVTKEATEEMLGEFEAMASWTRPVSDQELEDAKTTLIRGYAQRFETLAQIAGEIAELEGFNLPIEEMSRYTSCIDAVKLEDMQEAAKKYFRTQDSAIVLVGDLSQIGDGLRALDQWDVVPVDTDGAPI